MTVTWRIHKGHSLVCFRVSDRSSVLDTVDALRAVAADAEFSPHLRRLYIFDADVGRADGLDSTQSGFADILAEQICALFAHPAPVAFVFDPRNRLIADRYAATTRRCTEIYRAAGKSPLVHEKFVELAPALAWLGLPPGFKP